MSCRALTQELALELPALALHQVAENVEQDGCLLWW